MNLLLFLAITSLGFEAYEAFVANLAGEIREASFPCEAFSQVDGERELDRIQVALEQAKRHIRAHEVLTRALKNEIDRIGQENDEALSSNARAAGGRLAAKRERLVAATAELDELRRRYADLCRRASQLRNDLASLDLEQAIRKDGERRSLDEAQQRIDRLERRVQAQEKFWRMEESLRSNDVFPANDRWLRGSFSFRDAIPLAMRRFSSVPRWLLDLSLTAAVWLSGWRLAIVVDRAWGGYRRRVVVIVFLVASLLAAAWIWCV